MVGKSSLLRGLGNLVHGCVTFRCFNTSRKIGNGKRSSLGNQQLNIGWDGYNTTNLNTQSKTCFHFASWQHEFHGIKTCRLSRLALATMASFWRILFFPHTSLPHAHDVPIYNGCLLFPHFFPNKSEFIAD